MAPASIQRSRCSAERCDRKSLLETFAPYPEAPELSTCKRRRISDQSWQVLKRPSLAKFAVPARRSHPYCGRRWEHRDRFLLHRYTVVPVLVHARLREPKPTTDRQSKSPDRLGGP